MRILHISHTLEGGGVEQYLAQLIRELSGKGHKNFLLCGEEARKPPSLFIKDVFHVQDITCPDCNDVAGKLDRVEDMLKLNPPDILFFHQVSNPFLIDLLTSKRPSVRFVHDFKLICPDGKKTLMTKRSPCRYPLGFSCQIHAYRYRCMPRNFFVGLPLINHCRRIARLHRDRSHMVVASRFMKSVLQDNGFPENRIEVIPYFTTMPDLKDAPPTQGEPTVLVPGRLTWAKGIEHLLRAFTAVHKKARLMVVGDGPDLDKLIGLAKDLQLSSRVDFTGWLHHDDLAGIYRQCSLVVVPSIWPEPFGIVGIEAMAHQKPVVAFNVGGISEWLQHEETGFLVDPGDERGLGEKISLLIERRDIAEKMGRAGRTLVRDRFLPDFHTRGLLSLFRKTVEAFPAKPN